MASAMTCAAEWRERKRASGSGEVLPCASRLVSVMMERVQSDEMRVERSRSSAPPPLLILHPTAARARRGPMASATCRAVTGASKDLTEPSGSVMRGTRCFLEANKPDRVAGLGW